MNEPLTELAYSVCDLAHLICVQSRRPPILPEKLYSISSTEEFPLIISLTTMPSRIESVKYTLFSLFHQTLKPNKIILVLSLEEFPNKEKDLTPEILDFVKLGLEILWTERNTRSFKKLLPTLDKYPEGVIATADDDIYYRRNWLEILYSAYESDRKAGISGCLYGHRGKTLYYYHHKNCLTSYEGSEVSEVGLPPSFLNFATTGGGILFPPNSLHPEVKNHEKYSTLTPTADDIWFWGMAILNGTRTKIVDDPQPHIIRNNPKAEGYSSLWSINRYTNDQQFNTLLRAYPQILENLKEDVPKPFSTATYWETRYAGGETQVLVRMVI